ncbi:hypothetical protein ACO0QE_001078 [Hanseniaspora vineae]
MTTVLCKRCNESEAVVKSRKEIFCKECFTKFITLKLRKMLMSKETESIFKVIYDPKNPERENEFNPPNCKVLLPCSFGSSSLTVLHILIDYLKEQYSQHKKYGFQVEVLTLYCDEEQLIKYKAIIEKLKSMKDFQISKDILNFTLLDANRYFLDNNKTAVLTIGEDYITQESISPENRNSVSLTESLQDAFPTNKLATSKQDLLDIFIQNVIKLYYASDPKFKQLLWGSSMTKIADQVISNVVKGRGASIAKELAFGMYPLTDVFLSEIDAYFLLHFRNLYEELLYHYVPQPTLLLHKDTEYRDIPSNEILTKSAKTINQFAREYFDSIEGDYSNVISTVVRTALKLDTPTDLKTLNVEKSQETEESNITLCRICESPCYRGVKDTEKKSATAWLNNITVHEGHPVETDEEKTYYQQWQASTELRSANLHKASEDSKETVTLCYGCSVTVHTSSSKSIAWVQKRNSDKSELQSVLNDYVLSDNED